MSYEKVKQAGSISIGTKQTLRMVETGRAVEVYIASDADSKVVSKVVHTCQKNGIRITYVDSKKKLGKACGIEVSAAVAAACKDE